MSQQWITDRKPSTLDSKGHRVWVMDFGAVLMTDIENVEEGQPWMPITPPEPYLKKLQRWQVYFDNFCPSYEPVQHSIDTVCLAEDVAELETKYEQLEASHAQLLETVKGFLRWWDSPTTVNGGHIDRLRAAIAKAEGEVMP